MGDLSSNFSRHEFQCKCGCGFDTVDVKLLQVLEEIRGFFRSKIKITSGCRCAVHNAQSLGSAKSQHRYGRAVDFKVQGHSADDVADCLEKKYKGRFGIGRYTGRTHIDTRSGPQARWDLRL